MIRIVTIRRHEIGLRFRRGDFDALIEPGRYWVLGPNFGGREVVEIHDTRGPRFEHEQLAMLVREESVALRTTSVELQDHEVALVWVNGRLDEVVGPGLHAWWDQMAEVKVQRYDTRGTAFEHPLKDVLVRDERLAPHLTVVDLKDHERGIVWVDGRVKEVVGPGLHAWWKGPSEVTIERHDVTAARFEHPQLEAVMEAPGALGRLYGRRVLDYERQIVFRNGEMVTELGPGHFAMWRDGAHLTTSTVDMREQGLDVQGQDIITADKVSVRVNLLVTHRVVDAVRAVTEVADWSGSLYREAQLELRSAVGGRTLEQLLSDKDVVGREISERLTARATDFGVQVLGVGLRDIILPGDMKSILNEVILAQKQSEANVIRRREETAAARSQVNTARLLAENPVLARMKELEMIESILRGSNATFVLGSGELTEQIGALVKPTPAPTSAPTSASTTTPG